MATFADYLNKKKATTGTSTAFGSSLTSKATATQSATAKPSAAVSAFNITPSSLTPVASKTSVTKQGSTAPVTPATNVQSDAQAKIAAIQAKLKELTATQAEMEKYGAQSTEELATMKAKPSVTKTGVETTSEDFSSTDPSSLMQATQKALGFSGGGTDTQSILASLVTQAMGKMSDYEKLVSQQASPEETLSKYESLLGIPAKQEAVTALGQEMVKTNKMIDDLEENLNSRIGGTVMTESARQRELAVEQRPLLEQQKDLAYQAALAEPALSSAQSKLGTLLGMSQQQQTTQAQQAATGVSQLMSLIPSIASIAEYQSPQEKIAQTIAQEKLMKALELGDYAKDATETKPITLSPGQTLYDPTTGEALYTAPPAEEKPKATQIVGTEKTGFYSYDPNTGTKNLIIPGTQGGTAAQTSQIEALQQKNVLMTNMTTDPALSKISNKGRFTSFGYNVYDALPSDEKALIGKIEQMISKETLETLVNIKARGATFGSLTEKEMAILQSGTTPLTSWAVKDGKGRTLGYSVDTATVKSELETLISLNKKAMAALQTLPTQTDTSSSGGEEVISDIPFEGE
jgi:hypothetical protein